MEPVERIYCCDRDNNDNALAAAIMANGNNLLLSRLGGNGCGGNSCGCGCGQ